MQRAILILAVFLVGGVPALAKNPKDADAKLKELVNQAIDRGAKWLRDQQGEDGSFPSLHTQGYPTGPTALALLALLHSGEKPAGEVVDRGFAYLRAGERKAGVAGRMTYSVSVTIMALAEYGRALGVKKGKFFLAEEDGRWLQELTRWLVSHQNAKGVWHYPTGGHYDHSNSQYALLALKEARRVGVRVAPEVFRRALQHFLGTQEKKGPKVPRFEEAGGDGVYTRTRKRVPGYDRARGWGYVDRLASTGSMTAAGVAAVAICRGEIPGEDGKQLRAQALTSMRDGIAWLGKNFAVNVNPRAGPAWHYYYLYGLERSGVLAGVVYMDRHRWYAEGAKYLVDSQSPDGGWRTLTGRMPGGIGAKGSEDAVDPAFALLFLVRATARAFGVVTEPNLLNLTEAAKLGDADLPNVFVAAFDELAKLEGTAREERATDFAFFGPRVIPLLIKKLADPEEIIRARAFLVLSKITGKSFGYDPAGPPGARAEAIDRYSQWFLTNRKKLALDRAAKLIR